MYLAIAVTPDVYAAPPKPANGSTPASGLGQYRRRGMRGFGGFGAPVLRVPIPRLVFRGMGATQANPCACYWPLPGVAPTPGLPACNAQGCAPSCSSQQCATPFCSGIPYGQPGYTECLAATAQAYSVEEPQAAASLNTFIATLPASITKPAAVVATPSAPVPTTPAATPPVTPPQTGSAASPTQTSGPVQTAPTNGGSSTATAVYSSSGVLSFLEGGVSLFGFSLPVWAVGLITVGGIWAISSMGKGK